MPNHPYLQAAEAEGRVRVRVLIEDGDVVVRVYQPTELTLSELFPIIDHFGVVVSDEWAEPNASEGGATVDSFRVARVPGLSTAELMARQDKLVAGLEAVFEKKMASDPLNKLVLRRNLP